MKLTSIVSVLCLAPALMLSASAEDIQCGPGQLPVSVEGGQTGCAGIPICVGGFPNGNCPEGSTCGIVKTGVPGCKHAPDATPKPSAAPGTCAEVACSLPDFSTLCGAVKLAGVADALKGNTVFAPTNDAFTASGVTSEVVAGLKKEEVANILAYHVTKGRVASSALKDQLRVPMLQTQETTVALRNKKAFINGAEITKTDVETSDCTIHVINRVMMPPKNASVVEILIANPEASSLVGAVKKAELVGAVSALKTATILAPVNKAFEEIASVAAGLTKEQLAGVLTYHVFDSILFAEALVDGESLTTLNGKSVTVTKKDGNVFINDVKVIKANEAGNNGVIHYLEKVLIPK